MPVQLPFCPSGLQAWTFNICSIYITVWELKGDPLFFRLCKVQHTKSESWRKKQEANATGNQGSQQFLPIHRTAQSGGRVWEGKEKTGLLSDTGPALLVDQLGEYSPHLHLCLTRQCFCAKVVCRSGEGPEYYPFGLGGGGECLTMEVAASVCWTNKNLRTALHQTKDSSNIVFSSHCGQVEWSTIVAIFFCYVPQQKKKDTMRIAMGNLMILH